MQWVEGEIRVTRVARDPAWWTWALPRLREFWNYVERMEEPKRLSKKPQADAMVRELNALKEAS